MYVPQTLNDFDELYTTYHLLVFGERLQGREAVSHCDSWHPGVESNGHDEVTDSCQPVDASVYVLPEETADRLVGKKEKKTGNSLVSVEKSVKSVPLNPHTKINGRGVNKTHWLPYLHGGYTMAD